MARHRPPAIGLDFGTSTSLVARRQGGQPLEIVPLGETQRLLPSVAAHHTGKLVAGEDAENLPAEQTIRSVKRLITSGETQVTVGVDDDRVELTRDEVIVAILQQVKKRATANGLMLGRPRDLRIGCPAVWGRDQRRLLLDLLAEAGISVDASTLVEEPVAAGLAWLSSSHVKPQDVGGRLLVFDMGGGTLDIAVLDVESGDPPGFRVLHSTGLTVAGDALDEAIAEELTAELAEQGVDIEQTRRPGNTRAEVLRLARTAKIDLSLKETVTLTFAPAFFGRRIPAIRYGRDRLEEIFRPRLDDAEAKIWDALRLARLANLRPDPLPKIRAASTDELARDVDYVVLAGGMSRIPAVKRRIRELLPHAQVFDDLGVAADEAVVAGLADDNDADPLNLYRPGFDFTLSWGDRSLPLYDAYTPLYEPYQLHIMNEPKFTTVASHRQGLPQHGQGELRVMSATGEPVNLTRTRDDTTETFERFPIRFGHRTVRFNLYCDGRIVLIDGADQTHDLRVEIWPQIRGAGQAEPADVPEPKVFYPFNKS
jgi:molecular chaperone DnaK (HSP70)